MTSISFGDLPGADLFVDCVYAAGPQRNVAADPIQRLLPVGNQGGFRFAGARPSPRLVVLYTTGGITEWPDEVDQTSGILTYYGDNRHAGRALHDTPRGGNQILAHVFERMRGGPEDRAQLPVFLLFESVRSTRDVTFRGLVVPGTEVLEADEELIAIWRSEAGRRFQNYRAKFTVLDVPGVSREWINDVLDGNASSPRAPRPWVEWVNARSYLPLEAPTITPARSKDDQLPEASDKTGWELLEGLYDLYRPDPIAFESTAVKLARLALPGPIRMDITRPSVDGGRDAVGGLALGVTKDPVWVSVALEAKCYQPGRTSVGVRDMSRLISRLRYRDLGVLVTTSYVGRQAYQEIREDRHPVVVLSGGDLVTQLRRHGVTSRRDLRDWLTVDVDRLRLP